MPPRPVTEADFARSYIRYSDLFSGRPTWDTFFERLQDLGLQSTMAALSFLNSWLYLKGGIQAQAEMIGSTFDLDLQSRLLQLPDLETRVAYSPAQTLLVMRSALLHSPDRADTRSNEGLARALTEVLLMANDLLTIDERAKIDAATAGVSDPDALARAMLSFSIRTTVVNGADAYNTTLARASIILGQLAARDDVRQRAAGDAIYTWLNRFDVPEQIRRVEFEAKHSIGEEINVTLEIESADGVAVHARTTAGPVTRSTSSMPRRNTSAYCSTSPTG